MKPRKNTTIQERFGFADEDLRKPMHDDIIMWVVENERKLSFKAQIPKDWDPRGDVIRTKAEWEVPIYNGSFCVGFIDLKIEQEITQDSYQSYRDIFFEAKTKIESLGELFRQLNMYKRYVHGPIVVVCPDDKHRKTVESQGFGFVKYTGKPVV